MIEGRGEPILDKIELLYRYNDGTVEMTTIKRRTWEKIKVSITYE